MINDDNNYLGFIQLNRSQVLYRLIQTRNTAFCLFTIIALRARRTNEKYFDDLQIGEAFIGDYEKYGVTEAIYRTDKQFLKKYGLVTFRTTPRGTIARIVDTSIFDINAEKPTDQSTSSSLTISEEPATNNKEKNVNKKIAFNGKRNPIMEDEAFIHLLKVYHNGDDSGVRAKMSLSSILNSRYPAWRYKKEWDEANSILTGSNAN